jgi:nitroreductase
MNKPAKTDVPIYEILRQRWSPRAFDPRPIEPATLRRLFEAARWAPSSFNEQPWAFIAGVKDRPAEYAKVLECLVEFNQSWAKAAPLLLLTVAHTVFEKNGQPNRHAFHDIGLAMANLTFQATVDGVDVHQMAGVLPDKAKQLFGIPDGWEALTGVAVGYPGDPNTLSEQLRDRELAERTRKPAASFVFSGAWGKASTIVSS